MSEIKFVFDTNIVISAALSKNSISRQALDKARESGVLIFSNETVNELYQTLIRPKFDNM